ncbi:hypothetical protein ACFL6D_04065 [Spirochaetota bacterium]
MKNKEIFYHRSSLWPSPRKSTDKKENYQCSSVAYGSVFDPW